LIFEKAKAFRDVILEGFFDNYVDGINVTAIPPTKSKMDAPIKMTGHSLNGMKSTLNPV
jgi:hypothetical protein